MPTTKAALSCRAKIVKKMSLHETLEQNLVEKFENTGWSLVSDRHSGKVTLGFDDCSVEFQLQSSVKV